MIANCGACWYALHMNIKSAVFVRSVVDDASMLTDNLPQIAFIGRSNVGKSSLINAITGVNDLARSSNTPGHTRELNFFLINKSCYFVDLPGYGYAQGSHAHRDMLGERIRWYFAHATIPLHKVVLIIDAKVGPTRDDQEMCAYLMETKRDIVIVANKIDKLKANEIKKSLAAITSILGPHTLIPFSAEKKLGVGVLTEAILVR